MVENPWDSMKDKVVENAGPSYAKMDKETSVEVRKQVHDKVDFPQMGLMVDHILEESKAQVRRAKLKK